MISPAVDGDGAVVVDGEGVLPPEAVGGAGAVGTAGGIEAIVPGGDIQGAAIDGDGLALHPLVTVGNGKAPSLDQHGGIGMDAVIPGAKGPLAAGDGHIRAAVNGVVGGVQIKAAAADRQVAAGYGLGMSIARGIVVAHRGKIQATSPGENVLTVLVSLPLPR